MPASPIAVLWDMDGVLIDSEPLLLEAERAVFADYGVDLTPEMKKPFIGLGGHEVMMRMAEAFGVSETTEKLNEAKGEHAHRLLPAVKTFPQTTRLLELLAADGIPMAVASGSSPEMIMVALLGTGLGKHIPERVSVLEVAQGKPAPDVFLEAARRLDVRPQDCIVIEDAVHGVMAARAAGMRSIAIPYVTAPWDDRFDAADLVVHGGMKAMDPYALHAWIGSAGTAATVERAGGAR